MLVPFPTDRNSGSEKPNTGQRLHNQEAVGLGLGLAPGLLCPRDEKDRLLSKKRKEDVRNRLLKMDAPPTPARGSI